MRPTLVDNELIEEIKLKLDAPFDCAVRGPGRYVCQRVAERGDDTDDIGIAEFDIEQRGADVLVRATIEGAGRPHFVSLIHAKPKPGRVGERATSAQEELAKSIAYDLLGAVDQGRRP